ncbi:hypothetical protein CGRA01v4_11552 [Colletotrichum graminicola]|nr:hypothetical protein CGRA01v4_11552 [Colletotrichum graminicola]
MTGITHCADYTSFHDILTVLHPHQSEHLRVRPHDTIAALCFSPNLSHHDCLAAPSHHAIADAAPPSLPSYTLPSYTNLWEAATRVLGACNDLQSRPAIYSKKQNPSQRGSRQKGRVSNTEKKRGWPILAGADGDALLLFYV